MILIPSNLNTDDVNETYPDSPWLSSKGIFGGSVKRASFTGDPLTPGLPAIDGIYRLPINDSFLSPIPVQPVSFSDGMNLLNRLDGKYIT